MLWYDFVLHVLLAGTVAVVFANSIVVDDDVATGDVDDAVVAVASAVAVVVDSCAVAAVVVVASVVDSDVSFVASGDSFVAGDVDVLLSLSSSSSLSSSLLLLRYLLLNWIR